LRETYRKIVFSCQGKKEGIQAFEIKSFQPEQHPFPFDARSKIGYPSALREWVEELGDYGIEEFRDGR